MSSPPLMYMISNPKQDGLCWNCQVHPEIQMEMKIAHMGFNVEELN
jgi:hypothetical protein